MPFNVICHMQGIFDIFGACSNSIKNSNDIACFQSRFRRSSTCSPIQPWILISLEYTRFRIRVRHIKLSYVYFGTFSWMTYGATTASLLNSSDFQYRSLWKPVGSEAVSTGIRPSFNSAVHGTLHNALAKSFHSNTPRPPSVVLCCTSQVRLVPKSASMCFSSSDLTWLSISACIASITRSFIGYIGGTISIHQSHQFLVP